MTTEGYRSAGGSPVPSRATVIAAASAWSVRHGILRGSFVRAVERVELLTPVEPTAARHDELTGLTIVESELHVAPPALRPYADHHRVFFRLATGEGTVDLVGPAPLRVVGSEPQALRRRAQCLAVTALLGLVTTGYAASTYRVRDPWFQSHGATPILYVAGVLATIALTMCVGELLLGRPARRFGRTSFLAGCALAAVGWAVLSAFALAPRTAHALRAFEAGRNNEAFAEARAVDATSDGTEPSAVDALNLRLIPENASVEALLSAIHRSWRQQSARQRMVDRLRRAAPEQARVLLANHGPAGALAHLADSVAEWMPHERHAWRGAAALLSAQEECPSCPSFDGNCFRRHADEAREEGVSEGDIEATRLAIVPPAREAFQRTLAHAQTLDAQEPLANQRLSMLTRALTCGETLAGDLHGDPGADLVALRAEVDALAEAVAHPPSTQHGVAPP